MQTSIQCNLKQFCPFVVVIQIFIIDLIENFHDLTSKFQIGKRQINDDQKIAYWHALMFHITFHRNGALPVACNVSFT